MTDPVLFVPVGDFGREILRSLRVLRADLVEVTADDSTSETCPDGRLTVVASWRPVPALCDRHDAISHDHRRPFIPTILDARTLSIGPVVLPGAGSCWGCWAKRVIQHAPYVDLRSALADNYDRDPQSGPRGYLQPLAMVAAAQLSKTIDAVDAASPLGGHVWQLDIITRDITNSTVVGLHDCPRCGLRRPLDTRTVVDMQQALAFLWQS